MEKKRETGATIQVPRNTQSSSQEEINIRGTPSSVELAKQKIEAIVEAHRQENEEISIAPNQVAPLLGQKNSVVIEIQRESGARVYVDRSQHIVRIEGSSKSVEDAKARIQAILDTNPAEKVKRSQSDGIERSRRVQRTEIIRAHSDYPESSFFEHSAEALQDIQPLKKGDLWGDIAEEDEKKILASQIPPGLDPVDKPKSRKKKKNALKHEKEHSQDEDASILPSESTLLRPTDMNLTIAHDSIQSRSTDTIAPPPGLYRVDLKPSLQVPVLDPPPGLDRIVPDLPAPPGLNMVNSVPQVHTPEVNAQALELNSLPQGLDIPRPPVVASARRQHKPEMPSNSHKGTGYVIDL